MMFLSLLPLRSKLNRPGRCKEAVLAHPPPLPETYWDTFYTRELSRGVCWRLQTLAKPKDIFTTLLCFPPRQRNTPFIVLTIRTTQNAAIIY